MEDGSGDTKDNAVASNSLDGCANVDSIKSITDILHLRRFLCFGSELGRSTLEEEKYTVENAGYMTFLCFFLSNKSNWS